MPLHPFTKSEYKPGDLLVCTDALEVQVARRMATDWGHFKRLVRTAMERAEKLENGYGPAGLSLVVARRVRDSDGVIIEDRMHIEEIGIPPDMVK